MKEASSYYRLLGDEARLRLLRVLSLERLNVTELTSVLGLAQSGVSRHLKLLKDAGVVEEQKAGLFTYHALAAPFRAGAGPLGDALAEQFAHAADDPSVRADDARLQEILRLRKENFAGHRGDGDPRQFVPGRSWAAWSRALGLLLPPLRVADLGCGDGYLAVETSRWASEVIGIDRSSEMLASARALAKRRKARNITWKRGSLDKVPLPDDSVDVALLSQALRHAPDPAAAVAEAARIIAPGGRVLILELREHDEAWVREQLGEQALGFSEAKLQQLLTACGLVDVRTMLGASKTRDPFAVVIAVGRKAAGSAPATHRKVHAHR